MRGTILSSLIVVAVLVAGRGAWAADGYAGRREGVAVASVDLEWRDEGRKVTVPVKVWMPKETGGVKDGALPVIVFSHGLGGSREGYGRWAEYWAGRGYVVLVPTHVGSDTSVITGALGRGTAEGRGRTGEGVARGIMAEMSLAANAENAARRVKDVSFVIDQGERVNAGTLKGEQGRGLEGLKGKLDVKRVGMAGHSFGAQTTLRIAGQKAGVGARGDVGDRRVVAAVAMSPQPVLLGDQKAAMAGITIPVFHLTGTEDHSPPALGDVGPADRRVPFDASPGPAYLVVFQGATHMTFGGWQGAPRGARLREMLGQAASTMPADEEEAIHRCIEEGTLAFWDAYLKGDVGAKGWMEKELEKAVGTRGVVERKRFGPAGG